MYDEITNVPSDDVLVEQKVSNIVNYSAAGKLVGVVCINIEICNLIRLNVPTYSLRAAWDTQLSPANHTHLPLGTSVKKLI